MELTFTCHASSITSSHFSQLALYKFSHHSSSVPADNKLSDLFKGLDHQLPFMARLKNQIRSPKLSLVTIPAFRCSFVHVNPSQYSAFMSQRFRQFGLSCYKPIEGHLCNFVTCEDLGKGSLSPPRVRQCRGFRFPEQSPCISMTDEAY